jgi:hypothetical protein
MCVFTQSLFPQVETLGNPITDGLKIAVIIAHGMAWFVWEKKPI